jgi:hypothetical protein
MARKGGDGGGDSGKEPDRVAESRALFERLELAKDRLERLENLMERVVDIGMKVSRDYLVVMMSVEYELTTKEALSGLFSERMTLLHGLLVEMKKELQAGGGK